MNYQSTLDYLFSALPMFHRVGPAAYKANLDNTIALCKALGNPEKNLKCIHIAGTNGKGSTSHMLAAVLQSSGFKTGLYTSPHLVDFRERFRVNGTMMSKDWLIDFVEKYTFLFEEIKPSFFEMTTAMAFQYFNEQDTDIAVIETGLGGRLDSTNVISPEISVITNIGHDHMNLLGDTLPKVAGEKAGIIKKNIPVIIGEFLPETKNIFLEKAKQENAEIYFTQENYKALEKNNNPLDQYQVVDLYKDEKIILEDLKLDLTGKYQLKNICTVINTIDVLKEKNILIEESILRAALSNVKSLTGLAGRWQLLSLQPTVICDTAHNEEGLKEVLPMLNSIPHKNLRIVLGMVNDKDLDKVLALFPEKAIYYFCKADIPRGLDAVLLADAAFKHQLNGKIYQSVKEALAHAKQDSENSDVIFIGGSTFTVAEIPGIL